MNAHAKAASNYRRFHAREIQRRSKAEIPATPKAVTLLGNAVAVEYSSTKTHQGSNKRRVYRHKMGPGVKIYLHPNRKVLYVTGGKFRVTDWMRG